jgi:uncharacterized protein
VKNFIAFISAMLFATGLCYSQMTQPLVVKGFLDIFGDWNGALIGVMIGAILTHALFYKIILKRKSPLLDESFHLPSKHDIDFKLFAGAALFGLGWGWAGICPGPALAGLFSGESSLYYFIASMIIGMKLFHLIQKNR